MLDSLSTFKDNTEFAIGKLDSLFKIALPHLKDGAEALITYMVASAWLHLFTPFALLIIGVVGIYQAKKWLPKIPPYKDYTNKDDNTGRVVASVFATIGIIVVFIFSITLFIQNFSCAIKASVSPVVYSILKLSKMDCSE